MENYFTCCRVTFIANFDKEEGVYFGQLLFRQCTLETKDKVAFLYDIDDKVLGVFSLDSCFIYAHTE